MTDKGKHPAATERTSVQLGTSVLEEFAVVSRKQHSVERPTQLFKQLMEGKGSLQKFELAVSKIEMDTCKAKGKVIIRDLDLCSVTEVEFCKRRSVRWKGESINLFSFSHSNHYHFLKNLMIKMVVSLQNLWFTKLLLVYNFQGANKQV